MAVHPMATPWYVAPTVSFSLHELFLTPCVAQSLSHFSSLVQPLHLKSGGAKSVQKLRHQKVVSKFVSQKYFCENVG
jgi:hypothetical protein